MNYILSVIHLAAWGILGYYAGWATLALFVIFWINNMEQGGI